MAKKILIGLVLLVVVGFAAMKIQQRSEDAAEHEQAAKTAAFTNANQGISAADQGHMTDISKQAAKGPLSAADLAFVLGKMTHPLNNTPVALREAQGSGMMVLSVARHLTPAQKGEVYSAVHSMVHSPYFGIRSQVASLLGQLGDKRAIADLQPLLQDSNVHVAAQAKAAITQLSGKA